MFALSSHAKEELLDNVDDGDPVVRFGVRRPSQHITQILVTIRRSVRYYGN